MSGKISVVNIDRFEGEWAVLAITGIGTFQIPRKLLPANAQEGSVLNISITRDTQAEEILRTEVADIQKELMDQA